MGGVQRIYDAKYLQIVRSADLKSAQMQEYVFRLLQVTVFVMFSAILRMEIFTKYIQRSVPMTVIVQP